MYKTLKEHEKSPYLESIKCFKYKYPFIKINKNIAVIVNLQLLIYFQHKILTEYTITVTKINSNYEKHVIYNTI